MLKSDHCGDIKARQESISHITAAQGQVDREPHQNRED